MKSVNSSLCMPQNVKPYCYSDQGSPQLHLSYRTRPDETGPNLYIRTGEFADSNSSFRILEVSKDVDLNEAVLIITSHDFRPSEELKEQFKTSSSGHFGSYSLYSYYSGTLHYRPEEGKNVFGLKKDNVGDMEKICYWVSPNTLIVQNVNANPHLKEYVDNNRIPIVAYVK